MAKERGLLDMPVDRAMRVVALRILAEAADARARLREGRDTEALHDFRVALRRLRSWLRAFRGSLADEPSGRSRRSLRAVAEATNPSRDAEVQLAWLALRRSRVPLRQRAAFDALAARIAQRWAAGQAELDGVAERFDSLAGRLTRELSSYRPRVDVAEPRSEPTLSGVAARLVAEHAGDLATHLTRITSPADIGEAHAARIAGKRLRYVLEPLRGDARGARAVVDELKALQDVLGEIQDASVLAADVVSPDLPRVGMAALRRLAESREKRAFARLRREWPAGRRASLCAAARAVARRLDAHAREGIEIERKFLLKGLPPAARRASSVTIDQGYLPGRKVAERIRRVRYGRRIDYVRSIKAGTGIVRMEVEEKTTKAVFDGLWRLTGSMRLFKRRYDVPAGGLTWEIDEFLDRDLVLAEIELPSEDTPVPIPDWLAPHVVREVTGERAYENHQIALRRPGKGRSGAGRR